MYYCTRDTKFIGNLISLIVTWVSFKTFIYSSQKLDRRHPQDIILEKKLLLHGLRKPSNCRFHTNLTWTDHDILVSDHYNYPLVAGPKTNHRHHRLVPYAT